MDLIFRLFVIGFGIGICGVACAYGAKQAVQDTVKKIVAPILQDNKWLTDCLADRDEELKALRQEHFETNAKAVLIKEKNPSSSN